MNDGEECYPLPLIPTPNMVSKAREVFHQAGCLGGYNNVRDQRETSGRHLLDELSLLNLLVMFFVSPIAK